MIFLDWWIFNGFRPSNLNWLPTTITTINAIRRGYRMKVVEWRLWNEGLKELQIRFWTWNYNQWKVVEKNYHIKRNLRKHQFWKEFVFSLVINKIIRNFKRIIFFYFINRNKKWRWSLKIPSIFILRVCVGFKLNFIFIFLTNFLKILSFHLVGKETNKSISYTKILLIKKRTLLIIVLIGVYNFKNFFWDTVSLCFILWKVLYFISGIIFPDCFQNCRAKYTELSPKTKQTQQMYYFHILVDSLSCDDGNISLYEKLCCFSFSCLCSILFKGKIKI